MAGPGTRQTQPNHWLSVFKGQTERRFEEELQQRACRSSRSISGRPQESSSSSEGVKMAMSSLGTMSCSPPRKERSWSVMELVCFFAACVCV